MLFKAPVCGKRLQRGKAHIVIEYEGVNYYICCPRCQTEFEHNLKLYARPELGEKAKKDHASALSSLHLKKKEI